MNRPRTWSTNTRNSTGEECRPTSSEAIRYLNVTASGRQWINGLYSNVFRAEHEHLRLSGPQP